MSCGSTNMPHALVLDPFWARLSSLTPQNKPCSHCWGLELPVFYFPTCLCDAHVGTVSAQLRLLQLPTNMDHSADVEGPSELGTLQKNTRAMGV